MGGAADLMTLCARALDRDPAVPAIEFQGRWYDWGTLRRTTDALHACLVATGAPEGSRIAFVPRNRPSIIAALLGLIAAGRSHRMIYAFQSPVAIARDIDRLAPAIVIAGRDDMSDEVRAVLSAKGAASITVDDDGTFALAGFERATGEASRPDQDSAEADPRIEILTSGTTGSPKPFSVTFEMLGAHMVRATDVLAGPDAPLADAPPTLLYFPLGNISGLHTTLPPLLKGQRAILLDRFSLASWHDFVLRFRPTQTGIPPAAVQALLDADYPREDFASIRAMGMGAAPLDPTLQRAFEDRYGIPILLSYGATEFGGPVTMMTAALYEEFGNSKFGSVGRPFGGARIQIVDAETGDALPAGREGTLEVVSPRIGPDWIRTADIAIIDEDGFLFHRGRSDGAIVRGGFKILPETIERALLLHPAVAATAVVAVASRRLGQVPGAVIQPSTTVSELPTAAELETHLRDHVPSTHIPTEWRFVSELPKNPSMKIDRGAIRKMFEETDVAVAQDAA